MQEEEVRNNEKISFGFEKLKSKRSTDRDKTSKETAIRPIVMYKPTSHADLKYVDALCPVILDHQESIVEVHSPAQTTLSDRDEPSELITINISGSRFQTYLSTLERYPNTLLGDENKRKYYWNSKAQEYFFDRHRACFESILYFYQSQGRLRRPDFVPLNSFLEEISFFQLGPEAVAQVQRTENVSVVTQFPMPKRLWRRYIWYYLEFPQHSYLARIISLLSIFFTLLSCLTLAIETLPTYNHYYEDICKMQRNISLNSTITPSCSALFTSPFFIIQTICVTYFVIEFLLRLISTPSYCRFILSILNWIDLAAIVPYFVILGIQLIDQEMNFDTNVALGIRLLRVLRFARIFKLYVVFRSLKALRVLSSTIKESLLDFTVIIAVLTLIAFLFGTVAYFAEQRNNDSTFDSIPKATYWGIITITGVGYGDMYPVTPIGRILTCLCAFVGAGMMGMLISILVDRYQRVYNRKMFVPQDEIPSFEFKRFRSVSRGETEAKESSHKTSRRQIISTVVSHHLSSIPRRFKSDQQRLSIQAYKVRFLVSFDGENLDNQTAKTIVTTMKEKITEALPDTSARIQLHLMEKKNNQLWTRYNSDTMHDPYSNNSTVRQSVVKV